MTIRYVERELFIDGERYQLEHVIADAVEYEEIVVVLFDPDSIPGGFTQYNNLIALDRLGQLRWKAELPTSDAADRYYEIASRVPLVAYSTRSYDCMIDLQAGRITSKTFTK